MPKYWQTWEVNGWPLRPEGKEINGLGPLTDKGDDVDFATGSELSTHFV
jgi:hypothetical protein